MKIIRWETEISDYNLDFVSLIDQTPPIFKVATDSGALFEVIMEPGIVGPYVIADEEHLTNYWVIIKSIEKKIGSTFIIEPSNLASRFEILVDSELYKHYVVATSSSCLEVLSIEPPEIRRGQK
ncbi:MAG: hypothetical protein NPINA01_13110 [Nitrospinaceae bacterium]|nr:MAG: hypothetical protein NPINA01_13110 [Nitrospinaceae bacterium]